MSVARGSATAAIALALVIPGLLSSPVGASSPESVQMKPGPVRNLTVTVLNKRCFRLKWQTPYGANGSQYLVRVRGANTPPSYDFRSTTWKKRLKVCGLPENSYAAWVRQLGGVWTYEPFDLGNPW